jgi:GT2 family glycosyltransferase
MSAGDLETKPAPPAPKVWVVIVTWNRIEAIVSCLLSLNALVYQNFELVVVDNGSEDGTVERLRAIFPRLNLIANTRNQGYTGGNNAGIRYALERGADYVLILNNDTRVHPRLINELLKVAESDPRTAVVGAKAMWMDTPGKNGTIWAAWCELTYGPNLTWVYGRDAPDSTFYSKVREVDQVIGCGFMWRRQALLEVGLLDTDFFGYHEDVDWCYRARAQGWRVMYVGSAIVYHSGSLSSNPNFKHRMPAGYFLGRNAILFTKKHGNGLRLLQVIVTAAWGSLQRLLRGRTVAHWRGEREFWQGVQDGLSNRNRQTSFTYIPSADEGSRS